MADLEDGFKVEGDLIVVAHENNPAEFGDGTLRVFGDTFVENIKENTINSGVDINNVNYINLKSVSAPSAPLDSGEYKLFLDNSDLKLKVKNSSDVIINDITLPLTTKGDLLVHNGTESIRLPISPTDGYALVTDSAQSSGLKWAQQTGGTGGGGAVGIQNTRSLVGINPVFLNTSDIGSYYYKLQNYTKNAPSGNVLINKNKNSVRGIFTRLSGCPGSDNLTLLNADWDPYSQSSVFKTTTSFDGTYITTDYPQNDDNKTIVSLTGTSWSNVNGDTTGSNVYFIENVIEGPSTVIYVSKHDSSLGVSAVLYSCKCVGTGANKIVSRWQSGTGIDIQKTTSSDDGDYNVTNLKVECGSPTVVSLSGTTTVEILSKYQIYSNIVIVDSDVTNGPTGVFFVSKNTHTKVFSVCRIVNSCVPGSSLKLTWTVDGKLELSKSDNNYDGNYNVYTLV